MAIKTKDNLKLFILIFVIVVECCMTVTAHLDEYVIQTLEDKIDAENFTYFRLVREGDLRLELISLNGDVDIYCSTQNQHPNYYDYEMKSDTCGVDTVIVREETHRPVYIGVYGHPSYLHSAFKLTIHFSPQPKTTTYEDLVAQDDVFFYNGEKPKKKEQRKGKKETERSHTDEDHPLWFKIILGILEFGLDVII